MNINASVSWLNVNDGTAIRLQGIRGLWHKGPYKVRVIEVFTHLYYVRA